MWGKITFPVYRSWLHGLYGLHGPCSQASIVSILEKTDCSTALYLPCFICYGAINIFTQHTGGCSIYIYIYRVTSIGIPMLKIRRSCDRLIFNMWIPIPGKDGLYIETGPCSPHHWCEPKHMWHDLFLGTVPGCSLWVSSLTLGMVSLVHS